VSILLDQLTKRYEGHAVVNRVSLEVAEGEFFVLIGPSGSGKSTVLRLIAGLNQADDGRVLLHGRDVTATAPQQRGVGFVFQHYALFQHMSVADNVEFALRVRRVSTHECRHRRDELLELVGLTGLGRRMPAQLSGGQQQRVALARALAHRPEVLLLDEPFGALDARIRVELRRALRQIQSELGITTIFVTHDQEEAFELADRLGVMNFGRLLEVGTPRELYMRPQTEFVATFLGTANLLVGQLTGGAVRVGSLDFPLNTEASGLGQGVDNQRVQVLCRPEDVGVARPGDHLGCSQLGLGQVEQKTYAGSFEWLLLRLPPLPGVRPISPPVTFGDEGILIEATRTQDVARHYPLEPGDKVKVGVRRIHALVHPGLSFLIVTDGSPVASPVLALGGEIARLAHARVKLLICGLPGDALPEQWQAVKERLGGGLASLEVRAAAEPPEVAVAYEVERQPCDLVILGLSPQQPAESSLLAERLLRVGDYHLLLVPGTTAVPTKALVGVSGGEPSKEDVLFAGRFLRHLGAEATLLSVLPSAAAAGPYRDRAVRFLLDGVRTLEVLGVRAEMAVRAGSPGQEILEQLQAGGHDLLVLGAPLADRDGRRPSSGVVSYVLGKATAQPVLIVRSKYATSPVRLSANEGRIQVIEEMTA